MLPNLDTSKILAIACTVALLGAWALGMAIRPQTTPGGRGANAPALSPVRPFTPPVGFTGSHVYGLWTLSCQNVAGPAPAGQEIPRCNIQGLINAKRADNKVISLLAIRVVKAGPAGNPYLVMFIPARGRGDGTILFAIDENKAFKAPLKECSPTTCKVEAPLPAEALNQMLAGRSLRLQMSVTGSAEPAKFIYPLHGFRESYEALALAATQG